MAANIVSGVLDATSAGILLWAGLVECLAHDFVFDQHSASRYLLQPVPAAADC